jgi:hypothetical protein
MRLAALEVLSRAKFVAKLFPSCVGSGLQEELFSPVGSVL